jgi:hypothetical protein
MAITSCFVNTVITILFLATLQTINLSGREIEWLFSSCEGRRQLLESAGAGRLVVVHLVRDQLYLEGLQQVQEELSSSVMDFAPQNLPKNFKVHYFFQGHWLNKEKICLKTVLILNFGKMVINCCKFLFGLHSRFHDTFSHNISVLMPHFLIPFAF